MDYRDLLIRYIRHVTEAEGVNHINNLNDHTRSEVKFTPAEVDELEALEKLADDL